MMESVWHEYADALSAITALETVLAGRTATNDTPDGRLLLTLAWLRQEIAAQRLPIPVERSYVSTVYYLVGSGELDHIPGVRPSLGNLYVVLKGFGLIEERLRAELITLVDRLLADADRCGTVRYGNVGRSGGVGRVSENCRNIACRKLTSVAWPG